MTLATTPKTLSGQLLKLADDCMQVASHAPTLATLDAWESHAEQLRVTASLVQRSYDEFQTTARAFISAATKLLAAEEQAVHESRATRREEAATVAACPVCGERYALDAHHRHDDGPDDRGRLAL